MSLSDAFDHRNPGSLTARLRLKRFAFFRMLIDRLHSQCVHILDVGGTSDFWLGMLNAAGTNWQVTVVNLELVQPTTSLPWLRFAIADATALPFADRSFDVVFSNSAIEHVGGWNEQQLMAQEIRRVGKRYFVQTPNYYFPMEPHVLF